MFSMFFWQIHVVIAPKEGWNQLEEHLSMSFTSLVCSHETSMLRSLEGSWSEFQRRFPPFGFSSVF